MADNDLKIWGNHLLPNPFHMVDAKFDLVLGPISHANPAMPFLIFSKSYFQKHKSSAQSLNFDWMWLVNELVLNFSAPIKCAKAQFNLIILSRVMPHTTYYRQTDRQADRQTDRRTDRQTDTFVKTVFSDSGGSQNVKI